MENRLFEIDQNLYQWDDKARIAIALFAMRLTISIGLEDGVFKDKDEQRAKDILFNVKQRIDKMKEPE